MNPFFSIIMVCFNAGEELHKTLESIRKQSDTDYEILIKDGMSTDGSVERLESLLGEDERVRLIRSKDKGIYDAMNQATVEILGRYAVFMNCGDYFYSDNTLAEIKSEINKRTERKDGRVIFYGDTFERKTGNLVRSNPKLDAFACYRNIPCHQSCIYDAALLDAKLLSKEGRELVYDQEAFPIRADYEHFLWCFFKADASTCYLPVVVSSYEGGGFSENKANAEKARKEHKIITARYMTKGQRFRFRMILILTLQPLRTRLASSKRFSGAYQRLKEKIYGKKNR